MPTYPQSYDPNAWPSIPVPEPLRGADAGTFTEQTVRVRMPNNARLVLTENELPETAVSRMEALLAEMPNGRLRPIDDPNAPDVDDWNADLAPYLTDTWLTAPWFVAETAMYRRIAAAVAYFDTGLDPFAGQKEAGLQEGLPQARALSAQLDDRRTPQTAVRNLPWLLHAALWGNQADLSMWATQADQKPDHADDQTRRAHLLVDDSAAVIDHLLAAPGPVTFILDNAGLELLTDLCLADYLLDTGAATAVSLHAKLYPTFVSDATLEDVMETLSTLAADTDLALRSVGERLRVFAENGRLRLTTHTFWTSPLPLWQMPAALQDELAASRLVISKGDANYRRALGDAHWPPATPLAHIVNRFPAPILFLRTCKSEVIAGLPPQRLADVQAQDADWLVNGKWGLVQFVG